MNTLSAFLALLITTAALAFAPPAKAQECAFEDAQASAVNSGAPMLSAPALQASYATREGGAASSQLQNRSAMPSYAASQTTAGMSHCSQSPSGTNRKNWSCYSQVALQKQSSIKRSGSSAGHSARNLKRRYINPVHLLPGQTARTETTAYNATGTGTPGKRRVFPAQTRTEVQGSTLSAARSVRVMSYSANPGVIVYNTSVSPYTKAPFASYAEIK